MQDQVTDSINFALISTAGKTGIGGRLTDGYRCLGIGGGTIIASGPGGCDTATSVPTGGYVISGLALGKYQVTATAEGFQSGVSADSVLVESGQVKWCPFYLQPDSVPPTGIAGRITDYETGEPIYHAIIGGSGMTSVYSDSNGCYFISGNQGWHTLWSHSTGYEPGIYPESIHVVQGQITDSINFALITTNGKTGIGGRLTDASRGLGIGGGTIVASGPSGCDTATSVPSGGYVISGLAPGKYEVMATAEGFEPGVSADSVPVESGQVASCPFYLQPESEPQTGISGRVTDYETGEPIYHASLSGNGLPTTYTNANGEYFIHTDPGDYTLWACHDGYENGIYPESVHVVQDQISDSINFALISTTGKTGIGGRLTDASRMLGIGGGTIIASGPGGCDTTTSVPTGGYVISGLALGKYQVTAMAEGFQTQVKPESVQVESGHVKWCPFYLEPESSELCGLSCGVKDAGNGNWIFGALVEATGPGEGRANTGSHGTCTVRNLVPGTYLVRARAAGFEPSAWDTIQLTSGGIPYYIRFDLQPSGSVNGGIAGSVTDSLGQNPLDNARVFAWSTSGQGYAYTDSAGDNVITGLADGWYRVRAEAQGYYPARYPDSVQVANGQTTSSIDFRLRAVGSLDAGIAGFAYDGSEQVEIPNVHVRVTGGQSLWEVNAGGSGDYLIDGLPPGDYLVQVDATGYEPGQYPDIVTIANGAVASFVCPALYPPAAVAEPHVRVNTLNAKVLALPNPGCGPVRVQWQVEAPGIVALRVFDNTGRALRTIQNGFQATGSYSATWNGVCDNGRRIATGIFFYRLDAPGVHEVIKAAIVRR